MTRILLLAIIGAAIVTFFSRSTKARRILWIAFGLLAFYAVLKITGVIEALAPDRTSHF